MKNKRVSVLIAMLATSLVGLVPAGTAEAATGSATIGTIASVTVPWKGSTTVRPIGRVQGNATISSVRFTVKRGANVVARNRASARLSAGTYSVQTAVDYRPFTLSYSTKHVTQRTTVPAYTSLPVTCRVDSVQPDSYVSYFTAVCSGQGFDGSFSSNGYVTPSGDGGWSGSLMLGATAVETSSSDVMTLVGTTFSDEVMTDHDLTRTTTRSVRVSTRHYGRSRTVKRTQRLVIKSRPKPRGCATYAEFQRVKADFANPETYGSSRASVTQILQSAGSRTSYDDFGNQVIEFRRYTACARGAIITVGFENGYAYSKAYMS
ncbi:hypothetical protein [Oryzihumus sp.]